MGSRTMSKITLLRPLAVAGLCLMSSACIGSIARAGLLPRPTRSDAPQPRPGLWASPDAGCNVDLTGEPGLGPSLRANGTVVRAHVIGPPGDPASTSYVIAGGDPRILQMPCCAHRQKGAAVFYIGLRPTKVDDQADLTRPTSDRALRRADAAAQELDADTKKTPPPEDSAFPRGWIWHKGDDFASPAARTPRAPPPRASEAGPPSTRAPCSGSGIPRTSSDAGEVRIQLISQVRLAVAGEGLFSARGRAAACADEATLIGRSPSVSSP